MGKNVFNHQNRQRGGGGMARTSRHPEDEDKCLGKGGGGAGGAKQNTRSTPQGFESLKKKIFTSQHSQNVKSTSFSTPPTLLWIVPSSMLITLYAFNDSHVRVEKIICCTLSGLRTWMQSDFYQKWLVNARTRNGPLLAVIKVYVLRTSQHICALSLS